MDNERVYPNTIKMSDVRTIEQEPNRTERIGQALVNRDLVDFANDSDWIVLFYCPDADFYRRFGMYLDWTR